jgi:hypothetical protein
LHDGFVYADIRAPRLTADRASRSFEFAERLPETDRINDKAENEGKRNHFISGQGVIFKGEGERGVDPTAKSIETALPADA